MADEVLTERRDRVLLITLNRPEARNAVNSALAQALTGAAKTVYVRSINGGAKDTN